MNTFRYIFPVLFAINVFFSCSKKENHFLTDSAYRKQVHDQFENRKTKIQNRSEALFSVFEKKNLTTEQREALEFLFAYMPLCDLADYNGDFFLDQVNTAFKSRDYFSWGRTVPEDIFRHFVLVYRVNNEYLDNGRQVFFEELKERVKNLSMYDAALEVNHWCHEKVTYKGTDARTSSPVALVRTSWGRCGEESTFTTAALRSVGIPARQCYTPRWAHTDDNHAWVEVWIDGQWHYLGACEPEPELDVAWFTGPAKRAMMVHSTVFGLYPGPEEKNLEMPLYSKINLLKNYAEPRVVKVQVVDENNQPVSGAQVQFMLYNYAEWYPVATNQTDESGKTTIVSGKGDLMIWAIKNDTYGYEKSDYRNEITLVKLNKKYGASYKENFVVHVPSEQAVKELAPEKIAVNAIRLANEDSIRNAYMKTFINEEQARQLAQADQLNPDEVWKYLNLAQGNWPEIKDFILAEKNNPRLFTFLATLTDKELRDTPSEYLNDHLSKRLNTQKQNEFPEEVYVPYILSPHIEWELIRPWGNFLQKPQNVQSIVNFVKKQIEIDPDENYYNCRITPQGVYELKIADRISRDIFFVAACRSQEIPARIEQATGKPQYFEANQWIDAVFEANEADTHVPKARLKVQNAGNNIIIPGYYTHYTLACFKEGRFHTLDFENNPLVAKFPYQLELDEGYYRLMTGSRANDGSVFVHTEYFELKKDRLSVVTVELPDVGDKLFVKGIVDMNTIAELEDNTKTTFKELSKGKGLILCFIDPGKEPSKHILQDFPAVQQALNEWGGSILLMTPDDKIIKDFASSTFKDLPKHTFWSVDRQRRLLQTVANALQIDFHEKFPLTVYLSRNGGILYSSTGYRIGTGDDILKIIGKENNNR
jgi:transglutaminase-like putative cysteine protease